MFAQGLTDSTSMEKDQPNLDMTNETQAGGAFKKILDRLTQTIERKVDRQVLAAQLRADDTSSESLGNARQL